MKLITLLAVFIVMFFRITYADTMIVGSQVHNGTLKGYIDNNFIFETDSWKTINKHRTSVKKIILSEPRLAKYRETNYTPAKAKFIKYDKAKFFFKLSNNTIKEVYGVKMKYLSVTPPSSQFGVPVAPADTLKTTLNIKELIRKADSLSDEQKKAIKRYIAARTKYVQFQNESTRLVKQRDRETGKRREALIEQLHLRKNNEQLLIRELQESIKILNKEFAQ